MQKTTVYLTADQKRSLEQAARAEGHSEAHLIRQGIEEVIVRHRAAETTPLVDSIAPEDPARVVAGARRPRWMTRDEFVQRLLPHPADAGLRAALLELAPGTTDDVPLP